MYTYYIIALVVACMTILVWNFVPTVRERLRGYTTILENVLAGAMIYFGYATDALQDLVDKGYIPENYMMYIPFILLAGGIWARIKTSTPVGKQK